MQSSCLNSIIAFFIWMCHNRTKNNKINRIHERCLLLIENDKNTSFQNLLDKDKSVSIHHKNLRCLAMKMYRIHCGISLEILNDLFSLRKADQYNLRSRSQFIIPTVKTVHQGFQSLRYLGLKTWQTIITFKRNRFSDSCIIVARIVCCYFECPLPPESFFQFILND